MNKSGHLNANALHSSINGNMLTANRGHAFVLAPRKKLLCAHLFTITVTGGFYNCGWRGISERCAIRQQCAFIGSIDDSANSPAAFSWRSYETGGIRNNLNLKSP